MAVKAKQGFKRKHRKFWVFTIGLLSVSWLCISFLTYIVVYFHDRNDDGLKLLQSPAKLPFHGIEHDRVPRLSNRAVRASGKLPGISKDDRRKTIDEREKKDEMKKQKNLFFHRLSRPGVVSNLAEVEARKDDRRKDRINMVLGKQHHSEPRFEPTKNSDAVRSHNNKILLRANYERRKKKRKNRLTHLEYYVKDLKRRQKVAGDSRYLAPPDSSSSNQKVWLPFGFVMEEFAQRVLSRHIAQSNVVIVGEDLNNSERSKNNNDNRVGASFLRRAQEENHTTHVIQPNMKNGSIVAKQTLDHWWNTTDSAHRPGWVILTVLDLEQGKEDDAFSSSTAASYFLQNGPTMTYVMVGVTATTGQAKFASPDYNVSSGGKETVRALIQHNYKVQLLSATDFWHLGDPMATDGDAFQPNDLIDENNLDDFFEWGARAASFSASLVDGNRHRTNHYAKSPLFKAYLFATQGLDLAIPSRREYLMNGQFKNKAMNFSADLAAEREAMIKRVPFKACDNVHSRLNVVFRTDTPDQLGEESNLLFMVRVFCDQLDVTLQIIARNASVTSWMNTNSTSTAESFCIKLSCDEFGVNTTKAMPALSRTGVESAWVARALTQQVACATRIIPSKRPNPIVEGIEDRPNVLVVMIDPISRSQFDTMLPRSKNLLDDLEFVRFSKYTTVGDNSGPNQAAFYSGRPLFNRDGIASGTKVNGETRFPWLWDELRNAGYITFKAEDGCIANSNMVQSLQPNTTHGQALHRLFCFHFNRPNCVGEKLAADYLFSHAKQFMDAYSVENPWAMFLSLIDSHEDTMALPGLIDEPIAKFLNWTSLPDSKAKLDNTLVLLVSDHGLHYGPYFQSDAGEKERSEPVLYMKLPKTIDYKFGSNLRHNVNNWVTPFDVHETFLGVLGFQRREEAVGTSLLRRLPPSRSSCLGVSAIPARHCELVDPPDEAHSNGPRRQMPPPPSVLSFYADIPRDHRLKQETCEPGRNPESAFKSRVCKCATNSRDWFRCEHHPWIDAMNSSHPDEYYALTDCVEQGGLRHLAIDTRIVRQERQVRRLKQARQHKAKKATVDPPPNILFIEIDSVSIQYANRHFPKTRELLKRHRAGSQPSGKSCFQGLCAVDYSSFSAVGPNSVANQVAALGGCLATQFHQSCFQGDAQIGDICEDKDLLERGMRLHSKGPNLHTIFCPDNATDPYLYDIARSEGYFTFFGEEFCFPGSPWVVQDVVFPLRADIMLHSAFCRLASRRNKLSEKKQQRLFMVDIDGTGKKPEACLHGTRRGVEKFSLGLEQIRQVWDSYHDVPKFAYINAMAAHRYIGEWSRFAISAEAYDEYLSGVLKFLLLRHDANNTVIVVRGDHGFQGGGMMPIDYSTQIEHARPWTEIIVPDRFPVSKISENRDKMVTSYDLYRSLRNVMSGSSASYGLDWTYNIFDEAVPSERTCQEARVPLDFCIRDDPPPPTFGTCNSYEGAQAVYCRDPMMDATADPSPCGQNRSIPSEGAAIRAYELTTERWHGIDIMVGKYRGTEKQSGGIFLYPRQSFVLISILRGLVKSTLTGNARKGRKLRVCETGFGAGHSAALFQTAFFENHDTVEVISFDKFDRKYQFPVVDEMARNGFKLRTVVGNSCKTLPAFFANETESPCDFVHGSSFCRSDMIDLVRHLRPGGIVTATAMKNLKEENVYFGNNAQWRRLRDEGCIENIRCWKEDSTKLESSFVFAHEGTSMAHEFCVATSTGKCYSRQDDNADRIIAANYTYSAICQSSSQVRVPK